MKNSCWILSNSPSHISISIVSGCYPQRNCQPVKIWNFLLELWQVAPYLLRWNLNLINLKTKTRNILEKWNNSWVSELYVYDLRQSHLLILFTYSLSAVEKQRSLVCWDLTLFAHYSVILVISLSSMYCDYCGLPIRKK